MMGALATKQRSTAVERSGPKPKADLDRFAAYSIGGQVVLVDVTEFKFDGYTNAVVIRHDDTIGIEKPVPYGPGLFNRGPRASAYGVGRMSDGRFKAINPCIVIGRVIEAR